MARCFCLANVRAFLFGRALSHFEGWVSLRPSPPSKMGRSCTSNLTFLNGGERIGQVGRTDDALIFSRVAQLFPLTNGNRIFRKFKFVIVSFRFVSVDLRGGPRPM